MSALPPVPAGVTRALVTVLGVAAAIDQWPGAPTFAALLLAVAAVPYGRSGAARRAGVALALGGLGWAALGASLSALLGGRLGGPYGGAFAVFAAGGVACALHARALSSSAAVSAAARSDERRAGRAFLDAGDRRR